MRLGFGGEASRVSRTIDLATALIHICWRTKFANHDEANRAPKPVEQQNIDRA